MQPPERIVNLPQTAGPPALAEFPRDTLIVSISQSLSVAWCIRRHVYSKASLAATAGPSHLVDMGDAESDAYLDGAESDVSTDDDIAPVEVLEPYQWFRCRCPQPTLRMSLVRGESEYRCFDCLNAHPDQSAHFPHQIRRREQRVVY